MVPSIDLIAALLLLGVVQGAILSFVLFTTRRGNVRANRMLGWFVVLSSYLIFNNFLVRTKYLAEVPHLAIVGGPIVFLAVVPLYFYVRIMTQPEFTFRARHIVHLYPFLAVAAMLMPFYLFPAEEKIAYVYRSVVPLERKVREVAQLLQRFVYLALCIRLLIRHRRAVQEEFSTMKRVNLRWLLVLVSFTGIMWIAGFVLGISGISSSTSSVVPLILTILILLLGSFALHQPEIFTHTATPSETSVPAARYETSPLTEEYMATVSERLRTHMTSVRPFTDPNLTLAALAEQINVRPHHLSRILNEREGKNFFDFVNQYRIEEAKVRLRQDASKRFTLLSLAYDVGFNSKSVFNAAFKKHTGMTPSAFRKTSSPQ